MNKIKKPYKYNYDEVIRLRREWKTLKEISRLTKAPIHAIVYICNKNNVMMGRQKLNRKCKVEGCGKKHYAGGYCHAHYEKNRRGTLGEIWYPPKTKCVCGKEIGFTSKTPFCKEHKNKVEECKKYGFELTPDNINKDFRVIAKLGKRNPRWSGGASQYLNHAEMKRQRKQRIKDVNGRCELCSKKGSQIHHKDGGKVDHEPSNLIFLCRACHILEHRKMGTKMGRRKGLKSVAKI